MKKVILAAVALMLSGCGGGGIIGVYTGTAIIAQSAGGSSVTTTNTGLSLILIQGSNGKILIEGLSTNALTATQTGGSIQVDPNQMSGSMSTNDTQSPTISTGSGTLLDNKRSLNLSANFSETSGGNNLNVTETITYAGIKQ